MSARDLFEAAIGVMRGGWVLDLTTSQGGFARFLAERMGCYTRMVAADVDADVISDAHTATDNGRVQFIQVDACRLSFAGESFDTVSISASLHHMADPSHALDEAARILRPGGHLIVLEITATRRRRRSRLPSGCTPG